MKILYDLDINLSSNKVLTYNLQITDERFSCLMITLLQDTLKQELDNYSQEQRKQAQYVLNTYIKKAKSIELRPMKDGEMK